MKWSDIQFTPTNRVLRQFAGAWLVFWLAWAAFLWWKPGQPQAALALAALAVLAGVPGLLAPRTVRWLYLGCMIAAFPVGWVVSLLVLGLMYYVVITPVAWFFRLRGRDELHRAPPPEQASFWTAKTQPQDVRRYFRQY